MREKGPYRGICQGDRPTDTEMAGDRFSRFTYLKDNLREIFQPAGMLFCRRHCFEEYMKHGTISFRKIHR